MNRLTSTEQKTQWTSTAVPLKSSHLMKCETTNAILTFVLCALAVLGVIFALQTFNRTREFRFLQARAVQAQTGLMQIQQLQGIANDALAFNQKNPNPELTRILVFGANQIRIH
jgi:hypothetical protein